MYRIYKLVDPIDNTIRYVGRTNGTLLDRLVEHIFEVSTRSTSGTYAIKEKKTWLRTLLSKGLVPKIVLLERCHSHDKAIRREFYWTLRLKMQGHKLHTPHH